MNMFSPAVDHNWVVASPTPDFVHILLRRDNGMKVTAATRTCSGGDMKLQC